MKLFVDPVKSEAASILWDFTYCYLYQGIQSHLGYIPVCSQNEIRKWNENVTI